MKPETVLILVSIILALGGATGCSGEDLGALFVSVAALAILFWIFGAKMDASDSLRKSRSESFFQTVDVIPDFNVDFATTFVEKRFPKFTEVAMPVSGLAIDDKGGKVAILAFDFGVN